MMLSNYPDNVTGREWQIAGGDTVTTNLTCPECGADNDIEVEVIDGWGYWTCPDCEQDVDVEMPDPREDVEYEDDEPAWLDKI